MVTTIVVTILFILIPLAFVAGGFVAYKGVQLGLRWQGEVKQEQSPTLETPKIPNPIATIIESKREKESDSIVYEWLNGEK